MRNNSSIKWVFALTLLVLLTASAYPAAAASYSVSGYIVDINGNGIPGAKVVLQSEGLQIGDTALTANNGYYTISLGSLPWGFYQIFAEKEGRQSSTTLKVQGSMTNYTANTIMLRNYALSGVPATATPAPTATTATPAASPSAAPSPTPEVTAAPGNATLTPTPEASASASSTPVPTPGFIFAFVPAALALCLIAIRKRI